VKRLLKKVIGLSTRKPPTRWPLPDYDNGIQPHFLFLITPPYSGSTVIGKILNTGDRTMTLTEHGEGQWLVPGLCERDRWNPEKAVRYDSVKAVWLQKIQAEAPEVSVVIEKSPPNMMRLDQLSGQFDSFSYLANNREPYANCSSILYRVHSGETVSKKIRLELLEKLAEVWLTRSRKIRELSERYKIPLITYEQFCDKPSSLLDLLNLPDGVAESIDLNAKVKVKDYEVQSIVNQNERQIANLSNEEVEQVSKTLDKDQPILRYFGYKIA